MLEWFWSRRECQQYVGMILNQSRPEGENWKVCMCLPIIENITTNYILIILHDLRSLHVLRVYCRDRYFLTRPWCRVNNGTFHFNKTSLISWWDDLPDSGRKIEKGWVIRSPPGMVMKQLFEVPFQNIPMGMLVKQLYEVPPKIFSWEPALWTQESQVRVMRRRRWSKKNHCNFQQ